jgi:hypothetical protein
MQTCIIVLGMHRSGTSAFMGILNLLGINLGSELLDPSEDNPKGYFENKNIYQINERILNTLNSSWDDLFFLPENWWKKECLIVHKKEIIEAIEKEFKETEVFGLKDPRMCRLLPLWKDIFKEVKIKTLYVVSVRNPLAVANSLKNRDGFSIEKSILLWMCHMLDAEFFTRYCPRVFCSYDELLGDPKKTINSISNVLKITFNESYENVKDHIEQFLDSSLRHHNFNTHNMEANDPDRVVLKPIFEYYDLLLGLTNKEEISDDKLLTIDNMRKNLFDVCSCFYNEDVRKQRDARIGYLETAIRERDTHISNLETHISNLEAIVKEKDQVIQDKETHIQNIESALKQVMQSRAWRMANFLRRLFLIVRKRSAPSNESQQNQGKQSIATAPSEIKNEKF